VSHPIPLHTADRLERTFEALSQRVESSGEESWVMRILAMLISRCLDHFVAMIEDLLAKIRAGTIVLPAWAYEQAAMPASRPTAPQPLAPAEPLAPGSRRFRASRANHPADKTGGAPEPSTAATPPRLILTATPPRLVIRGSGPAPYVVAFHSSAVPRGPVEKSRHWEFVHSCVQFVAIS
jgi:hypothetical protein